MKTRHFCNGDLNKAKVLVVGHDPRLQDSDTQAEYAFFSDYYFRPIPKLRHEKAKFALAKSVFDYVNYLTQNSFDIENIIMTNLCNIGLPHAPKNKMVLIPEMIALEGIEEINVLLEKSQIEFIFPMSEQVNFWLQIFNFYQKDTAFLEKSRPHASGINHTPPFYKPQKSGSFQLICGRSFKKTSALIFPILHVKCWPLKGNFVRAYSNSYASICNYFKIKQRNYKHVVEIPGKKYI